MDQWKQNAIKVLRKIEFGETIQDYGDPDDHWSQAWEEYVCPICKCEGYHADNCELQQLLTPPREQLLLLKKLYGKTEYLWLSISDISKYLGITKGKTEKFIGDMVTYGLLEKTDEYGDWLYEITCTQEHINELLKITEGVQSTSDEQSEQSVEQSEKEEQ